MKAENKTNCTFKEFSIDEIAEIGEKKKEFILTCFYCRKEINSLNDDFEFTTGMQILHFPAEDDETGEFLGEDEDDLKFTFHIICKKCHDKINSILGEIIE